MSARLGRLGSGLLLLVCTASCDKLPFIGDDDSDNDKADKHSNAAELAADHEAEHEAEIEAAKREAVQEHKQISEAEIEARIEAATKKALAEHSKQAKPAAKPETGAPIILSNLKVKSVASVFGPASHAIELKADAKLQEAVGNSTYIHVKAVCEREGHVLVDVGNLNANYTKQLHAYAEGETAEVNGTLFSQGVSDDVAPCQFSFKLGSMGGGGISVDIGQACWDGKTTTLAACEKPIAAVAASGAASPVELLAIAVNPSGSGASKLNLNYELLFHADHDPNNRITIKVACHRGGKSYVELGQVSIMPGPFVLEPGESIARASSHFWHDGFGFAGVPKLCDLTTVYWTQKPGTYGKYDRELVRASCLRDGKIGKGRCDGGTPTRGTPTTMTTSNVALDEVELKYTTTYGGTGEVYLEIRADLTLSEMLNPDQGLSAIATCKVGKEKRIETAYLRGAELHYLLPGETTMVTSSVFGGNAMDKPKWCQVDFKGGQSYGTASDKVDLASYCLKREKLKLGKC
ncbi:MAG: hypothetical protein JKY37_16080 [Nannocystaceae bacterium]|nr:hypothetical protein [Nannocystaceae bacterium]